MLERLDNAMLVTPNERLAREHRKAILGQRQKQAQADRAWRHFEAVSLRQFLTRQYSACRETEPELAFVLSDWQALLIAKELAPQHSAPNLKAALEAVRLSARYNIPDADFRGPEQTWQAFATAFRRRLKSLGAILAEEIPAELKRLQWRPHRPVVVTELETLSPFEQDYLRFLQQEGVLHELQTDTEAVRATPVIVACEDPEQEWQQAARWAKQVKIKDPRATVGIVVPDLASHHAAIAAVVGKELDPAHGSLSATFDITGGSPLAQQPVWQAAHLALSGLLTQATADELLWLLRSDYLSLDAHALSRWPQGLGNQARLDELVEGPQRTALQSLRVDTREQSMGQWVAWMREALEILHWPAAAKLGSVQYQAYTRIEQVLTLCADAQERFNAQGALHALNLMLGSVTFAAERPAADILVLGQLETTGLTFTHLWLCALDETRFPGRPFSNPHLTQSTAATYGVPRSNYALELDFARQQLENWRSQTTHLRCSYAVNQEDAQVGPSPLLIEYQDKVASLEPSGFSGQPGPRKTPVLETYTDDTGQPLTARTMRGGASLLQAQFDCPIRAYGLYRLGLKERDLPSDLLDARLRGTLLHDVLQRLFEGVHSQAEMQDIDTATIRASTRDAIAALHLDLPATFVAHEQSRIEALVTAWLDLERARAPFSIEALEKGVDMELDGLTLRARIDRIDRVGSQLLIIDYKTGRAPSQGMLGNAPSNLQFPLYALYPGPVSGVLYGQLQLPPRLGGVLDESLPITEAERVEQVDWPARARAWRSAVNNVARGFVNGHAALTPRKGACTYCHLERFCRISDTDRQSE